MFIAIEGFQNDNTITELVRVLRFHDLTVKTIPTETPTQITGKTEEILTEYPQEHGISLDRLAKLRLAEYREIIGIIDVDIIIWISPWYSTVASMVNHSIRVLDQIIKGTQKPDLVLVLQTNNVPVLNGKRPIGRDERLRILTKNHRGWVTIDTDQDSGDIAQDCLKAIRLKLLGMGNKRLLKNLLTISIRT